MLATYRLEHTSKDFVARTLSAWSISTSASIAVLTALGGLLADLTSPRTAIAVVGLLALAAPLLLPRADELVSTSFLGASRRSPYAALDRQLADPEKHDRTPARTPL